MLSFIRINGAVIHRDTLHSAMQVVSRLCSKIEPQDSMLENCTESLSNLLQHDDHYVCDAESYSTLLNLAISLSNYS